MYFKSSFNKIGFELLETYDDNVANIILCSVFGNPSLITRYPKEKYFNIMFIGENMHERFFHFHPILNHN